MLLLLGVSLVETDSFELEIVCRLTLMGYFLGGGYRRRRFDGGTRSVLRRNVSGPTMTKRFILLLHHAGRGLLFYANPSRPARWPGVTIGRTFSKDSPSLSTVLSNDFLWLASIFFPADIFHRFAFTWPEAQFWKRALQSFDWFQLASIFKIIPDSLVRRRSLVCAAVAIPIERLLLPIRSKKNDRVRPGRPALFENSCFGESGVYSGRWRRMPTCAESSHHE